MFSLPYVSPSDTIELYWSTLENLGFQIVFKLSSSFQLEMLL